MVVTKDNITIKVIKKNMYIDYETYEIEVTNNTQNTIMLDDLKDTKNIYIQDNNKIKYTWNNYEYLENDITVLRGFTKNIFIKFNRSYHPTTNIKDMCFTNVKLNNKNNTQINITF